MYRNSAEHATDPALKANATKSTEFVHGPRGELSATTTVGTFNPALTLKALEMAAESSPQIRVTFWEANYDLELLAHAVQAKQCDMFFGHLDHHGVVATGGLTPGGDSLLRVLRNLHAWYKVLK
jgi:hypothetical protein